MSTRSSTSMTKEQLKNALVVNQIPLPASSAKKEEYQKLYDEKVVPFQSRSEFSSDEEGDIADGMDGGAELEALSQSFGSPEVVKKLTDGELYSVCVKVFGKEKVGPILDNTRSVYQNRLSSHFGTPENSFSANSNQINGANDSQSHNNGTNGFSDSDDDVETASRASRASRASATPSKGTPSSRARGKNVKGDDTQGNYDNVVRSRSSRQSENPRDFATERGGRSDSHEPLGSNQATATSGRRSMRQSIAQEEPGVSYFMERPGYSSTTTSNVLPLKPIPQKKEFRPRTDKEELEPPKFQWIPLLVIVVFIAICGWWYINGSGFGNLSSSEETKDELDTLLESLNEGN